MRTDEHGNACPETLGEYRDLCDTILPGSKAVEFLDEKIKQGSRDDKVMAPDSQMRAVLFKLMSGSMHA